MEKQSNIILPYVSVSQDNIGDNEEIFEIWRASVSPYFECYPVSNFVENLQQSFTQINSGKFLFSEITMAAQQYTRSHKTHKDFSEADHILLETFESGYNCTRNGDSHFIENGGISAINLSQPVEAVCSENAKASIFVLPRQWLLENIPRLAVATGPIFERHSIHERLFKDFISSIKKQLLTAGAQESSVISDSLIAMLDVLCLKSDFDVSESIDDNIKSSIKKYINENIGNLSLTADTICNQFFMSRSTLYRLFKEDGGVTSIIREYRLAACFKALHDPINAKSSVAEIALKCGIPNSNYLSSQFRDRYDLTPRQIRERQREAEWSDKYRIPADKKTDYIISNMVNWARYLT
ncbi:helix-turn-helix transcriptional regulator [Celerinatantimonas diazotrophica]|uniref:AraC-like DNA-binding protein n=1 Tax=Celerinatantimonas diazotrophica TaxID=412034 RepID=A0A4R1K6T3_9GAMM|nr:AraC family transcriptional regulator [Celerinatantimonas diazotrophica]TCK58759.1 AraC-like DNA-binding protein [Celerinatantimonas diazotrophica]CAG9297390.1 HTH-type transcriptional activator RhaS [Celerinatantimonas diazotrophica]